MWTSARPLKCASFDRAAAGSGSGLACASGFARTNYFEPAKINGIHIHSTGAHSTTVSSYIEETAQRWHQQRSVSSSEPCQRENVDFEGDRNPRRRPTASTRVWRWSCKCQLYDSSPIQLPNAVVLFRKSGKGTMLQCHIRSRRGRRDCKRTS